MVETFWTWFNIELRPFLLRILWQKNGSPIILLMIWEPASALHDRHQNGVRGRLLRVQCCPRLMTPIGSKRCPSNFHSKRRCVARLAFCGSEYSQPYRVEQ